MDLPKLQEESFEYTLASTKQVWYVVSMKITDTIHSIPLMGNRAFLVAEEQLTLIDTGMPFQAKRIIRYIRKIGRKPGELKYIILTHHHIDHRGSARALQAYTGATVLAHREDVQYLQGTSFAFRDHLPFWVRLLLLATDLLFRQHIVQVDKTISEGDAIQHLRVLHTPGHTPGSISLYYKKHKALFCGDTAPYTIGKLKRPNPFTTDRNREMESLTRLATLDCQLLLPNDCTMVFENGQRVLQNFCSREKGIIRPTP